MSHDAAGKSFIRALSEITIIVLGILIAFSLDAGWDVLQERRAEQQAIRDLTVEFSQTRADLARWIEFHRKTGRNSRIVFRAMSAAPLNSRLEISDTLIAALMIGPTFDPITSTLDALATAGRLSLITDSNLRESLAVWRSRLFDAQDEELQARSFIDNRLIPRLAEAANLLRPVEYVVPWIYGAFPDSLKDSTTLLRVSSELTNLVAVRLWLADGAADELDGLAAATDDLIYLLRRAHR